MFKDHNNRLSTIDCRRVEPVFNNNSQTYYSNCFFFSSTKVIVLNLLDQLFDSHQFYIFISIITLLTVRKVVFPFSQKILVIVHQINDFFQTSSNQYFQNFPDEIRPTIRNIITTSFRPL